MKDHNTDSHCFFVLDNLAFVSRQIKYFLDRFDDEVNEDEGCSFFLEDDVFCAMCYQLWYWSRMDDVYLAATRIDKLCSDYVKHILDDYNAVCDIEPVYDLLTFFDAHCEVGSPGYVDPSHCSLCDD